MKRNKKNPKRILLVRTDRIGDVVLTTPAIRAVRQSLPESFLAMMVRPYSVEVVKNNPHLDEVIVYDKRGKHKTFWNSFKFVRDLRKKEFDLAFVFHPTNRVNIITFLAGIPERIGYNRKCGFLLTKKLPDEKFKGEKHEIEYNLEVIAARGISAANKEVEMVVSQEEENFALKFFQGNGLDRKIPLVAIQPGASCPSKRWPVERFAEVGKKLMESFPVKIIIIGSNEEGPLLERLRRLLGEKAVIVQGLALGNVGAILKQAQLFISNDTGPVHIAAAMKTPCLVIFGRKQPGLSPRRWRPRGREHIIFHKDPGCQVCLAHSCDKGFQCLKAITVFEVFQAAQKILGGVND